MIKYFLKAIFYSFILMFISCHNVLADVVDPGIGLVEDNTMLIIYIVVGIVLLIATCLLFFKRIKK